MALQIILVAGSGMITWSKDGGALGTRPSQDLFYNIQGTTLKLYEKKGDRNQFLESEIVTDIQNQVPATLLDEAAVRAYLDPIIGVQKTV